MLTPKIAVTLALLSSPAATAAQIPATPNRVQVAHLLNRAGYGPRPGDVERVLEIGIGAYLDQQLRPETISDELLVDLSERFSILRQSREELTAMETERTRLQSRLGRAGADSSGESATRAQLDSLMRRRRRATSELRQLVVVRAVVSERQVYEVMVDFWSNHFNIDTGAKNVGTLLMPEYIETVIRHHALGNFRDLLGATVRSPAMLMYLDNFRSFGPDAVSSHLRYLGSRIDQTRSEGGDTDSLEARLRFVRGGPSGMNENYARELLELHTVGVDGGYTQEDVIDVARILTGWGVDPQAGYNFVFRDWAHDDGAKTVMGMLFRSAGPAEGERLLDMLAGHPSTRRFISGKLCARFVSDNVPPGCVDAAVAAWEESGGEIAEVVRAILSSPEFWDETPLGSKVKTPLEFVAGAVRAIGAYPNSSFLLFQQVGRLGQPLLQQPEPTGYPEDAESWMNAGAILDRINFVLDMVEGRPVGVEFDLSTHFPATSDTQALIAYVNRTLLYGRASDNTLEVMSDRVAAESDPSRARAVLLELALGSPEFQRQ